MVDTTVNIVFCFGPRLGLKTEVRPKLNNNIKAPKNYLVKIGSATADIFLI